VAALTSIHRVPAPRQSIERVTHELGVHAARMLRERAQLVRQHGEPQLSHGLHRVRSTFSAKAAQSASQRLDAAWVSQPHECACRGRAHQRRAPERAYDPCQVGHDLLHAEGREGFDGLELSVSLAQRRDQLRDCTPIAQTRQYESCLQTNARGSIV
jgi:hypothetical protein